jgi:hypothetical protein
MATTRMTFRPLTAVCLVLAAIFVVVGIVYVTKSASGLPSFFPGHEAGVARHHTKHGIASFGLAVLALAGAWFTTAPSSTGTT